MTRRPLRTTKTPTATSTRAGLINGFRSGLEEANAQLLMDAGVAVEYEQYKLRYQQPSKDRVYTPDFVLPNGIVIETKGYFTSADRQKHLMIRESHPNLELRFVFSNANTRISKTSKTTYGDWANHKGFRWANHTIPSVWLTEAPRASWQIAATEALGWRMPRTDEDV